MKWLREWWHRYLVGMRAHQRERRILKACGCICRCVKCGQPLNDQPCTKVAPAEYRYECSCGYRPVFNFDICPVPIDMTYRGLPHA